MAFDFSYMDKRESNIEVNEPYVKIWNNKGNKTKNSYFFLNKHAVAMLNNAERVKIGIDVETKKIVITPAQDLRGRQLSKNTGGSATIAMKALIEDNNLPTKCFRPGYLTNYAPGGIIFSYAEKNSVPEEVIQ